MRRRLDVAAERQPQLQPGSTVESSAVAAPAGIGRGDAAARRRELMQKRRQRQKQRQERSARRGAAAAAGQLADGAEGSAPLEAQLGSLSVQEPAAGSS